METSCLTDLFTGLEVYYKMLHDIKLEDSKINKAYHLCWRMFDGPHILFEIHEKENYYKVYNFVVHSDPPNYLNNLDDLREYMIKYIDLKIRNTFVYN